MEFRLQPAWRWYFHAQQKFLRSSGLLAPRRLKAGLHTSNQAARTERSFYATVRGREPFRAGRNYAFSLIEVMVALVVLGVALVGLTQGVTTALSSNKESELQTEAALIAAGQIETLRATGDLIDGETDGNGGEGLAMYHWKQTISATDIDGLHEVSVAVQSTNSSKLIYELQTYIFDPGDTTQDDARDQKNPSGAKKKDKKRK